MLGTIAAIGSSVLGSLFGNKGGSSGSVVDSLGGLGASGIEAAIRYFASKGDRKTVEELQNIMVEQQKRNNRLAQNYEDSMTAKQNALSPLLQPAANNLGNILSNPMKRVTLDQVNNITNPLNNYQGPLKYRNMVRG